MCLKTILRHTGVLMHAYLAQLERLVGLMEIQARFDGTLNEA